MYREYLGESYRQRVRKILGADNKICSDMMIDADFNIGAMRAIIGQEINKMQLDGAVVNNAEKYSALQEAALYALAGVLCVAISSRVKVPPFNKKKYAKDWVAKQRSCLDKAHLLIEKVKNMG